jgi:ATP-binding cassette, subfamily A (ABC1), member 3
MTASAWDKFLLLSWKNWIIQLRHPVQTIFEVLVPIIVCSLIIVIRGLVDISEYTEDFRYEPNLVTQIDGGILRADGVNLQLAYSPFNPLLGGIVQKVADELNFTLVLPFANATELEKYAVTFEPFASFEFDDGLKVNLNYFHVSRNLL